MSKYQWRELPNLKGEVDEGDEIYHEDLLLGTVTEVTRPLFRKGTGIFTIASEEAYQFLHKEAGIDKFEAIQVIKVAWYYRLWNKIKRWLR
jgi:hypothetical protein